MSHTVSQRTVYAVTGIRDGDQCFVRWKERIGDRYVACMRAINEDALRRVVTAKGNWEIMDLLVQE